MIPFTALGMLASALAAEQTNAKRLLPARRRLRGDRPRAKENLTSVTDPVPHESRSRINNVRWEDSWEGPTRVREHRYNGTQPSISDSDGGEDSDHDLHPKDHGGGIIGGGSSPIDAFRYMVSLRVGIAPEDNHICGGTLISTRIVLTAAHCVKFGDTYLPPDNLLFNQQNSAEEFRIPVCGQEFGTGCDLGTEAFGVVHQDYEQETFSYFDVALLFLPIEITSIPPVALNTDPNIPEAGDEVVAAGWGLIQENPDVSPDDLHNVTLEYIQSAECQEEFGSSTDDFFFPYPSNPISSDMMCTYADGKSACFGDSGGTKQVGITSWGDVICVGKPGVFSRVSSSIDWIQDTACEFVGEHCDECYGIEKDEVYGLTDLEVDRLPAIIQKKIDSGALVWDEGSIRKPEKKMKPSGNDAHDIVSIDNTFGSIIGGGDPQPGSQPYQVSIGLKALQGSLSPNGHVCSGSLIAADAVLSSASCFTDDFENKVKLDYVELHRYDLYTDPGVLRMYIKKSDIVIHPEFNLATLENDLALVFLPSPIFDIKPVKLDRNTDLNQGETMNVMGWGSYFPEGPPSNLPRAINVNHVHTVVCNDPEFNIEPSMMCATPADEKDGPCDYDWGNPLIKKTPEGDLQVGVFSTGNCRLSGADKSPPCDSNEQVLQVEITTDDFPEETAWKLTNLW
ncbi:hypothetical protein ACHAWF_017840 [Thalassiosira exigua]